LPSRTGDIAGLVLAGGESRRMGGGHKFLLKLAGETMLDRVIARLSPQVAALAISANCDPALLAPSGLPILADPPSGSRGPLSGIGSGLSWAASQGFSHIATAASDTPFFPEDLVARLLHAAPSRDAIALAASGGRVHPVFGLWPVSAASALDSFLREETGSKMTDFVSLCEWTAVDFAFASGFDPFFNINTQDDLAAARRRIGDAA
jgi:molybdenum cofactor guanylyltransferase